MGWDCADQDGKFLEMIAVSAEFWQDSFALSLG
jgi:hypothetical protein